MDGNIGPRSIIIGVEPAPAILPLSPSPTVLIGMFFKSFATYFGNL